MANETVDISLTKPDRRHRAAAQSRRAGGTGQPHTLYNSALLVAALSLDAFIERRWMAMYN